MGDIENDLRAYKSKKQQEADREKEKFEEEKEKYLNAANEFKMILMPILRKYEETIHKNGFAAQIEDLRPYPGSGATLYFRPDSAQSIIRSGSALTFIVTSPDQISIGMTMQGSREGVSRGVLNISEATPDRLGEEVEAFIREVLNNS